jgi:IclR family acetate operon transcriptional repressor
LAFSEDTLLGPLLSSGLEARTPDTIVDPDELRADLAEIRRRGYSISRGDATAGVGALGAPVFDATGRAIAGLSVGGLLDRVSPEREPAMSARLLACCRELSTRLGAPAASEDQPS